MGGSWWAANSPPSAVIDRLRLARLNPDGTLDVGYNAGAGVNGYVSSLIPLSDGKALIGGSFTSVGGTNRNYIARVNPDGSVDASFDPGSGFNGVVLGMAPQPDGKLVVGGQFSLCNGVSRAYLARLHANGSLDATFMPAGGFNGHVNRVVVQPDGKILAAGSFSTVNGVYRNYLARLNSDGSLDTSFDPGTGPNSPVNGLGLQPDGRVLIGGTFTVVNGVSGGYLARLETNGVVGCGVCRERQQPRVRAGAANGRSHRRGGCFHHDERAKT